MRASLWSAFLLAAVTGSACWPAEETIVQPARKIPVLYDVDVCVIGGGLSGFAAGVAAARNGARTLIVERTGYLGGWMRSVGLGNVLDVPGWRPRVSEGLLKEIADGVAPFNMMPAREIIDSGNILTVNYEAMSQVFLRLAEGSGAKIAFFSTLSDVQTAGGRIESVIVQTHLNRYAVRAKVFIDCTGMATVAKMAGAPVFTEMSSMGLASVVDNVDVERFNQYIARQAKKPGRSLVEWVHKMAGSTGEKLPGGLHRWLETDGVMFGEAYRTAVERGELSLFETARPDHPRAGRTAAQLLAGTDGIVNIHEGIKVWLNPLLGGVARPRTFITGIDVGDFQAVNDAHIVSQKMLFDYARFLAKYVPGFEKAQISRLADATLNRAGRSIENDFTPIRKDVETERKDPTAIAILHRGDKAGVFEVPYSTLLPAKVENLMAVGKSSGGGSNLRLHSFSVIHGQAAGTAAALCVKTGSSPRTLDVKLLQRELKRQGVVLPE